ncbi:4Fe-4S binding protein [Clostridiaceae bacterium HFYG-1003]|nr:4Fe-4S binding protein [Clostridiaceae bacterium HFYG-1003]
MTQGCVACGNCLNACPFAAITINRGIRAKVDPDRCKGCRKCVQACPASIIVMEKREVV